MRVTFVERANRFVAHVRTDDGAILPVHVASSGRMAELLIPGVPAEITYNPRPDKKTVGTLMMVAHGDTWVSTDTGLPGRLLRTQITDLPPFTAYTQIRPEYTYGDSRIDFLLTADDQPPCLVEVKSVTSALPDADGALVARFPDAPTDRGAKHLRELMAARQNGYRTAVLFVIQRDDAQAFGPWHAIDPTFAQTLAHAQSEGVEIHAYKLHVSPEKTTFAGAVPLRICAY